MNIWLPAGLWLKYLSTPLGNVVGLGGQGNPKRYKDIYKCLHISGTPVQWTVYTIKFHPAMQACAHIQVLCFLKVGSLAQQY